MAAVTPAAMRGSSRTDALWVVAGAATLVTTAAVILGGPRWGVIRDFLVGGYANEDATLAFAGLLVWIAVLGAALIATAGALRQATEIQLRQLRWTRATMFGVAGAIMLGIGIAHRVDSRYVMCCGASPTHIQEALQLAR